MNRSELKQKAKDSLKGKYGEAIKIFALYYLINFAVSFILSLIGISEESIIPTLITFVISALLSFGLLNFFLKLSRNEEVTYKELFNKTDLFIPYIAISLLTGLFVFLWSLLFIIPGIIASFNYTLVYYIKLDNPDLSTMDVLRKSKELMKGHRFEYFVLGLSFLGWEILGLLTLGILYLWLIPYIQVTTANFYNKLLETNSSAN